MTVDVIFCKPCHEDVCICIQAVGTAIGAASLAVDNLLDASLQLRFPGVDRDISIFAVENVVYGVGAVGERRQRLSLVGLAKEDHDVRERRSAARVRARALRKKEQVAREKKITKTHLQAVPSLRYSSSSDPCRLGLREFARECAGEFKVELALEDAVEATRERALRETVLPLSRAWRRRSCMVSGIVWVFGGWKGLLAGKISGRRLYKAAA